MLRESRGGKPSVPNNDKFSRPFDDADVALFVTAPGEMRGKVVVKSEGGVDVLVGLWMVVSSLLTL